MDKKTLKNRYVEGFGIVVIVLALVRCAMPQIAGNSAPKETAQHIQSETVTDSTAGEQAATAKESDVTANSQRPTARRVPHKILSVGSYKTAFPDTNALQLTAARRWGVTPVQDRKDAEKRMKELVFMGMSPYYHVDKLDASIPYLVPRAAILLEDIGKAYYDSLNIKGIPLHKLIVTSVLRTKSDVRKLRNYNGNATENSCHLYGTTFDICYNRYKTVEHPDGPKRRMVSNDTLKWVLSEVLRDQREKGRCYIKYEVKQGCFHLTVR